MKRGYLVRLNKFKTIVLIVKGVYIFIRNQREAYKEIKAEVIIYKKQLKQK